MVDCMTITKVSLPLYTFLLKDSSGAVFLRHGEDLWLPLFTSLENAALYAKRASLECTIHTLHTSDMVKRYIQSPPSRSPTANPEFLIAVDPVLPQMEMDFGFGWVSIT
jgi:hypothetical protein